MSIPLTSASEGILALTTICVILCMHSLRILSAVGAAFAEDTEGRCACGGSIAADEEGGGECDEGEGPRGERQMRMRGGCSDALYV
jgi:hypothetical protein